MIVINVSTLTGEVSKCYGIFCVAFVNELSLSYRLRFNEVVRMNRTVYPFFFAKYSILLQW